MSDRSLEKFLLCLQPGHLLIFFQCYPKSQIVYQHKCKCFHIMLVAYSLSLLELVLAQLEISLSFYKSTKEAEYSKTTMDVPVKIFLALRIFELQSCFNEDQTIYMLYIYIPPYVCKSNKKLIFMLHVCMHKLHLSGGRIILKSICREKHKYRVYLERIGTAQHKINQLKRRMCLSISIKYIPSSIFWCVFCTMYISCCNPE